MPNRPTDTPHGSRARRSLLYKGRAVLRKLDGYGGRVVAALVAVLAAAALGVFFWTGEQEASEAYGQFAGEYESSRAYAERAVPPPALLPTPSARSSEETSLWVMSRPFGAVVRIDEQAIGRTPLRGHRLASGPHRLSIEKRGYRTVDTTVVVGNRKSAFVLVTLGARSRRAAPAADGGATRASDSSAAPAQDAPPSERARAEAASGVGELRLASEPAGAQVLLDDAPVGETPLRVMDVPAGRYALTLQAEGYAPYRRQIIVRAGERNAVDGQLDPLPGALSVLVQPWGRIFINGELRRAEADVRYRTDLPAGKHRLTVEHPALGTWERILTIEPNQTKSIIVDFSQEAASSPTSARSASPSDEK